MPRVNLPFSIPIPTPSLAAFIVLTPTTKFVLIVIALAVGLFLLAAFIGILALFFVIRKKHPDVKEALAHDTAAGLLTVAYENTGGKDSSTPPSPRSSRSGALNTPIIIHIHACCFSRNVA
jgi:hypothetical protein